MKKYFILSFLYCSFLFIAKTQTIQTQYGPVTGHTNGLVYEFLGIPYASPPIDTLRWKPTQAHANWTTPLLADNFPPACPQKSYEQGDPDSVFTLDGEEDCLYLNVWSTNLAANLPVMVFIHGGGNQQGATSQISGGTEIFNGKNLALRGNVVVVTIEYRLGVLGYLVHPGLELENPNGISGNYAVMDQIFALQWIHDNIVNFGGDPNNVTIFGESAGGLNVGNLLTTPMASRLFHKAIMQSAVPVLNEYNDSKTKGIDFVNEYIGTGSDSLKIAYMRTVHPDSITIKMGNPLKGGVVQMNWQPVVDNYVFSDMPINVFQGGTYNKVPLIIGSNSEEMSFSVLNYPNAACAILVDSIIQLTVPTNLQSNAYVFYPIVPLSVAKKSAIAILTDPQFAATARRTSECISLNQLEPVWRYFFTHKHTFPSGELLGSYHGMELFYVFNNWENATLGSGILFKPADDSVQNIMMNYWANFAKTGNPNGSGLVSWPQYQSPTDCYIEIKATPNGGQCGLLKAESDLWDKISGFTACTSSANGENVSDNRLLFYPNPTTGFVIMDLPDDMPDYELSVYNILGEKVLFLNNSNHFDLTSENDGIFLLEVKSKRGIFKGKIIKTR